jgi:EAL and modified HD-GYP domain-containing signal transduction protein
MKGFRFAIHDFNFQKQLMPFLPHCSFVKVDLRVVNRDQLTREMPLLRGFTASPLAENVETMEDFEFCRDVGFQYFQGYFFCRLSWYKCRSRDTVSLLPCRYTISGYDLLLS